MTAKPETRYSECDLCGERVENNDLLAIEEWVYCPECIGRTHCSNCSEELVVPKDQLNMEHLCPECDAKQEANSDRSVMLPVLGGMLIMAGIVLILTDFHAGGGGFIIGGIYLVSKYE